MNVQIIIEQTKKWLTDAVIGLNLCPFAKSVMLRNQIRFEVCESSDPDKVLSVLRQELTHLSESPASEIETSLLILPNFYKNFSEFNEFLMFSDLELDNLRLRGKIQIADFHPLYQFAGTASNDIENYTNRSPYPILHLLRESSIEHALRSFSQPETIYQRNIQTLHQLGHQGWVNLGVGSCEIET
jgi:hypothetical protein